MALTALDLPSDTLKQYRPLKAIRRRKAKMSGEISKRRRRALVAARKAGELLKSEFGAKEVILFGSLARRGGFTLFSDIDLAARGIPSDRFFEAVDVVLGLSAEFRIDLIDIDNSSPALLKNIKKDGRLL